MAAILTKSIPWTRTVTKERQDDPKRMMEEPLLLSQHPTQHWSAIFRRETPRQVSSRSSDDIARSPQQQQQQEVNGEECDDNDIETGSSTSSLSDPDFCDHDDDGDLVISHDEQKQLELLSDQAFGRFYYLSERGLKLIQAFSDVHEINDKKQRVLLFPEDYLLVEQQQEHAMIRQQREIECQERNHSTAISCLVLIGVGVVFAWVYVFGLADSSDAYGQPQPQPDSNP